MHSFQIGDTIWYETGFHTASRARVVGIDEDTQTYIVHIIDHSPEQTNGSEVNTSRYQDGGIGVSWRKCKPVHYIGNEK